jgi:hypothetical protein
MATQKTALEKFLRRVQRKYPKIAAIQAAKAAKDSPKHLSMQVIERDRKWAIPLDSTKCVGAKCLKRYGFDAAVVGRTITLVVKNGIVWRFRTPSALRWALNSFDRVKAGEAFPLGTYVLRRIGKRNLIDTIRDPNRAPKGKSKWAKNRDTLDVRMRAAI